MADNPLLSRGIETGWLEKFFGDPFNPLCVMLAMRTKLLLDVVDEMGKSYNLLRGIGFGWIDFGDIPGENPGDPDDYIPDPLNRPIGDGGGGDILRGPPAYNVYGGGVGHDNPTGSMAPASGFGGVGDPGAISSGTSSNVKIDCCKDVDDLSLSVSIEYITLEMECGEVQSLVLHGYNPACETSNFTWTLDPEQGDIDVTNPLAPIYTAPASGADCVATQVINLYCVGELVDSIVIALNTCPVTASILFTTNQMRVDETQTLTIDFALTACGAPEFTWTLAAGSGALSHATGDHTVYTAPATNVNCAGNPTITLSCGGVVLDTLKIAVNSSWSSYHALTDCCQCDWNWCKNNNIRHCEYYYNCDGTLHAGVNSAYCQGGAFPCHSPVNAEGLYSNQTCTALGWIDGVNDTRTAGMKTEGCCPYQVIV